MQQFLLEFTRLLFDLSKESNSSDHGKLINNPERIPGLQDTALPYVESDITYIHLHII